ncbi:hypothetical protein JX266_009217 [Neoarthrinium moseri]|nr:hypothetical protein JX266_009217 [Neoarthrinium moseri]
MPAAIVQLHAAYTPWNGVPCNISDELLAMARPKPPKDAAEHTHVDITTVPCTLIIQENHVSLRTGGTVYPGKLHLSMDKESYMQQRASLNRDTISTETNLSLRGHTPASSRTVACETTEQAATYSSVAPFNTYPLSYDSLPTPVSVAGSPSMLERAGSKMSHTYNGSNSQQGTPPNTGRISHTEWFHDQAHSMMTTSQAASPMAMHPSADILAMHGLESTGSPRRQSMAVSAPGSPPTYFGSYGVSGDSVTEEDLSPHMSSTALFTNISSVDPSSLTKTEPTEHYGYTSPPMSLSSSTQHVPILGSAPTPGGLGPPMTPIDGLHHPFPPLGHPPPLILEMYPPYKRGSRSKNTKRAGQRKRSRTTRRNSSIHGGQGEFSNQGASSAGRASPSGVVNSQRMPHEKIKLSDAAPKDTQFLFNTRLEMESSKGKAMWERIADKYAEQFERKERAALQMQLNRAVFEHSIWPESEDRLLLEAAAEYDNNRYDGIIKIMKERNNGSMAWDWKPPHIIKRLVELGEEEYDPEGNGEKGRKSRKKKQSQRTQAITWNPTPGSEANVLYDDEAMRRRARASLSVEEADMLFNNVWQPEMEPEEPDLMQISEPESSMRHPSAEQDMNQAHSERVAKQACQQLMAKQHRDTSSFYGSPFPERDHHMS